MKLKFALPLVQVALALVLLVGDYSWQKTHRNWGASPAFSILVGINAPVAVGRAFWFRHLPGWWDDGIFILAIGLFWYWVALNISAWRKRKTAWIFRPTTPRLVADSVIVAFGGVLGFVFFANMRRDLIPTPSLGWFWFSTYVGCFFMWSLILIVFFGRDFITCLSDKLETS